MTRTVPLMMTRIARRELNQAESNALKHLRETTKLVQAINETIAATHAALGTATSDDDRLVIRCLTYAVTDVVRCVRPPMYVVDSTDGPLVGTQKPVPA